MVLRCIAGQLGRAPSTISREVDRNGGRHRYRAVHADRAAWQRARRPNPARLATDPLLRTIVAEKLARRWSPEQIAGWLARRNPDRPEMCVSHETIYRSLFVQSRGALRRELTQHLRSGRTVRRPLGHRGMKGKGGGKIVGAVHIRDFWWIDHGRHLVPTLHIQNAVEGLLLAGERAPGGQVFFLADENPVACDCAGGRQGQRRDRARSLGFPGCGARPGTGPGPWEWRGGAALVAGAR